jgi:hypothetical protein
MDTSHSEGEYRRIKAQFEAGTLSEADFKAQLENLMLQDEQGRWWMIGYETGRWYVHDGQQWIRAEPPGAEPPQPTALAQPVPKPSAPAQRTAQPSAPTQRTAQPRARKPWLWIALGVVGVVLLAVVMRLVTPGPGSTPAKTPAPAALPPAATRAVEPTKVVTPTEAPAAQPPGRNRLLYVYYQDPGLADVYREFLAKHGFPVDAITVDQVAATDLAAYDLVIIGPDTLGSGEADVWYNAWGDAQSVSALVDSGKPVLGLEEGGLGFFGRLGLAIGGGHAWHGSDRGIRVADRGHPIFRTPIPITGDSLTLYAANEGHVGIFMPDPPPDAVLLGRELGDDEHYPIVMQAGRFLLWGFRASPFNLTADGEALLINTIRYFLSLS